MLDDSQSQFCLLPESADELVAALHRLQASACKVADLGKVHRAQIGDLVFLQVRPDRLDRVEFRRVGRQERDGDVSS